MKHLWEFVNDTAITLHRNVDQCLPQRAQDRVLMTALAHHGIWGPQLAAVNRCCLYLRVVMLSDISTGDSLKLQTDMVEGRADKNMNKRYEWPD